MRQLDDKYESLGKLHEGGMGTIYKVRHRLLDQLLVVKVLRPQFEDDPSLQARFLREAQAAVRLRHPNIAQLYDFTVDPDGTAFMVMEYIEGLNLGELLATFGPPPLGLVTEIGVQALRALGFLHRKQFVHRDISTDNLMITVDEESRPRVKLIDLGIVKALKAEKTLTKTGLFLGKTAYASPEHFGGVEGGVKVEARSDIYSFGVVLYELLTGALPVLGENLSDTVAGHLYRAPRPFSETDTGGRVPAALQLVVISALAKKPSERPATAELFAKRLTDVARTHPERFEVDEAILQELASRQRRVAGEAAPPTAAAGPSEPPAGPPQPQLNAPTVRLDQATLSKQRTRVFDDTPPPGEPGDDDEDVEFDTRYVNVKDLERSSEAKREALVDLDETQARDTPPPPPPPVGTSTTRLSETPDRETAPASELPPPPAPPPEPGPPSPVELPPEPPTPAPESEEPTPPVPDDEVASSLAQNAVGRPEEEVLGPIEDPAPRTASETTRPILRAQALPPADEAPIRGLETPATEAPTRRLGGEEAARLARAQATRVERAASAIPPPAPEPPSPARIDGSAPAPRESPPEPLAAKPTPAPQAAARPERAGGPPKWALLAIPLVLVLAAIGLFFAWSGDDGPSEEPPPSEVPVVVEPSPVEPTTEPEPEPAQEPLGPLAGALADALLLDDGARIDEALAALLADEAELSPAECDLLGSAWQARAGELADTLGPELAVALDRGELDRLRSAVAQLEPYSAAVESDEAIASSWRRARGALAAANALTTAVRRSRHRETLEAARALDRTVPAYQGHQDDRRAAAEALVSEAMAVAREGRFEEAGAIVDAIVERWRGWPEEPDVRQQLRRLEGARLELVELLADAEASLAAGRPERGLELLSMTDPTPALRSRFDELEARLEAELGRLDERSPTIEVAPGQELQYKKDESAQVDVIVRDDHGLVATEAWARAEGRPEYQRLDLGALGGDRYRLVVPPEVHGNEHIEFYLTATDHSGHEGRLGTPAEPRRIERRRWFDRFK